MHRPSTHCEPTDYTFRFDAPIERRIFGDGYNLSGWLFHSQGEPITGIRAVLRRPLARRQIFSARRKRSRPDIAAAFPHLPEAKTSGFLLELRLGLGRNRLTFQVRDKQRAWHSFHTAVITAYPLRLIDKLGFQQLRQFLIAYLQARSRRASEVYVSPGNNPTTLLPKPSRYKQVALFATTKSNLFILEIGELIAAGFRELGCDARLCLDQLPARNPSPDLLQIIVTPHEYYNLFLTQTVSSAEAVELTRNVVLYCTEQPETGWFYNNLPWAREAKAVADINSLGAQAYAERDISSYHFRLGYHEILAVSNLTPHWNRQLDITFIGSLTPRRERFFAQHGRFFASRKCHLRFVPLGFAKTKITRSYLSPERRNELLGQTRILLNVHYSEQKYLEWHRTLVGLANGCCVISETSKGFADLVPGKHFIMADREDLIACCDYYLTHPQEAKTIADQGRDFVTTQLRQSQTCLAFLQALESQTSAHSSIVSADVTPVALPKRLSHALKRQKLRQLKHAITNDWQILIRRVDSAADLTKADVTLPSRALVITGRDAYRTRLTEQESKRAQGEQVWNYHDNDQYGSVAQPQLSIVITLFNYAHHISECVQSIEKSAELLSAPTEIIIVNDASTDSSLEAALRCLRSSALPMRIVDKRYNTGLADARNVGIGLARAPYLFMMDADNLVFPNALRELFVAITGGDYAAAYSLLCRFKKTTGNRVGLLSYYDWDPQILVQQPYIDAMAMFRRDALLQNGGYDNELSQIGWFGWEDYDTWLRFAQSNLAVAFVPNILCLYRHHETSMINLTNLFEKELVEHFLDRYRDLASKFEPREMLFGVSRESISSLRRTNQTAGVSVTTHESLENQRGGNANAKPGGSSERFGL
jgi:glycosyltransferase involved in cell wall biosynthesis